MHWESSDLTVPQADDYHWDLDANNFGHFLVRNLLPPSTGIYEAKGSRRFFFPDSPTTALFLTPEERVLAVQRIKSNQAGTENKHWKREQCVDISLSTLRPDPT